MIRVVFSSLRLSVFVLAAISAVMVLTAVSGTAITVLKWGLGSAVAATALLLPFWVLTCKLMGAAYGRRRPGSGGRFDAGRSWIAPAICAVLISAAGFGAAFFPPIPHLSVYCLRPLGSWSAPFLYRALEDPEAGSEAGSELRRNPKILQACLPELIASVQAIQDFKPDNLMEGPMEGEMEELQHPEFRTARRAMGLMGSLGTNAAAAVPVLIGDVRRESRYRRRNPQGTDNWGFFTSGLDTSEVNVREGAENWQVLIRIGKPGVPAIAEALSNSDDSREFAVLATVLGAIGPDAADAVPVLLGLLEQWQGVEDKSVERVLLIQALGGIGAEAEPALPLLFRSTRSPIDREQESAVSAIGSVGRQRKDAVEFLVEVIKSSGAGIAGESEVGSSRSSQLVSAAIRSLASMNPIGRERLVEFVDGQHGPAIAQALTDFPGGVGEIGIAALRKAMESATEFDRFKFACAIEAISGSDEKVIAVYIDELGRDNLAAISRLEKQASSAKAAIPELSRILAETTTGNRWSIARALWAVGQDPELIRPAVLEMLRAEDPGPSLKPEFLAWLKQTTIQPDAIVDALQAGLQSSDSNLDERVWALTEFPPASRKALPEIRKLRAEGKIGGGTYGRFLLSLSLWDTVRFSIPGKAGLFLVVCTACLLVECFVFRWRLRPFSANPQNSPSSGS